MDTHDNRLWMCKMSFWDRKQANNSSWESLARRKILRLTMKTKQHIEEATIQEEKRKCDLTQE